MRRFSLSPPFSVLNLVRLPSSVSLFEQLCLEEALLRTDGRNWCLFRRGTDPPTIVMGISGVAEKLINVELAKRQVVTRVCGWRDAAAVCFAGTLVGGLCIRKWQRDAAEERPDCVAPCLQASWNGSCIAV